MFGGALIGAVVYVVNCVGAALSPGTPKVRDWNALAEQIQQTTDAIRAESGGAAR
jgi:hypothetical protein